MKTILFFDTETTGLPNSINPEFGATHSQNGYPKCIQLSWIMTDLEGNIIKKASHYLKADGFRIPTASSEIHGITDEILAQKGEDRMSVLKEFYTDMLCSGLIVCHNTMYDMNVIFGELHPDVHLTQPCCFSGTHKCLCTMETTKAIVCKLNARGELKRPRLSELHFTLFGEDFDGAHNAMCDVEATMRCFFELKRCGYYSIRENDEILINGRGL